MEIKYKIRKTFSVRQNKYKIEYCVDDEHNKYSIIQDFKYLLSNIPKDLDCAKNYIESEFGLRLASHESLPKFFIISKSEELLASLSRESTLTLWNLNSFALICIVKLNYPRITSAVFTSDEKRILFSSNQGNLDYFDIDSRTVVPFHVVPQRVDVVAVSYDSSLIWYSTFESKHVYINSQGFIVYQSYPAPIVTSAIFSKFTYTLYTATIFGNLCIYMAGNEFTKKTMKLNLKVIKSLVLTPDEQLLCLVQNDHNITIMELNGYTIIKEFNENNAYLVTRPEQNSIIDCFKYLSREYASSDTDFKKNISYFKSDMDESVPLAFLQHTNSLLYSNYQGVIKSFNFKNLQSSVFLSSHSIAVTCYVVAANGCDLITGGADGTVRVWDLRKKSEIFILSGNCSPVYLLYFTFDNKKLVSVNFESHIIVWNSASYEKIQKFCEHKLKIISLSCDKTSEFIVSASYDSTIKIWRIENGECTKSIELKYLPDSNFATKNYKYHVDTYFGTNMQMFRVWKFF